MRTKALLVGVVTLVAMAALVVGAASAAGPEVLVAGDAHGLSWARGESQNHAGATGKTSPLIYHNGPVMTAAPKISAIYWGTSSWGTKIADLTSFYQGLSGSNYDLTNDEYTDSRGSVSTQANYLTTYNDPSGTPSKDPGTSGVLAEVAKMVKSPTADGYYPVYTDIPRGNARYCAWHSWGTVNGTMVQFAFFFNLDGDPGCDPGSYAGHSQGSAALANVSGHEFSEMLTDPQGSAWYDRQGAENADKCAWNFNGTQTLKNGTQWVIQGNWSNRAGGCIWG